MKFNRTFIIFTLLFAFSSSPIAANQQTLFGNLTKKEVAHECVKSLTFAACYSFIFTGSYALGSYIDGTNPNMNTKDYLRLALNLASFFVGMDLGAYLFGKHSLHTLIHNNRAEPEVMGYESYAIGNVALHNDSAIGESPLTKELTAQSL